jgi:hypothetical protein
MKRFWKLAVAASLLSLLGARRPYPVDIQPRVTRTPDFHGTLSVLTYNVKGLPWPIALGRSNALAQIGAHLSALRRSGQAPQVVVLQEAFTAEAQFIGVASGYRSIVSGPDAAESGSRSMTRDDRAYAAGQRWWKGEAVDRRAKRTPLAG